jgi:hypothetical protein
MYNCTPAVRALPTSPVSAASHEARQLPPTLPQTAQAVPGRAVHSDVRRRLHAGPGASTARAERPGRSGSRGCAAGRGCHSGRKGGPRQSRWQPVEKENRKSSRIVPNFAPSWDPVSCLTAQDGKRGERGDDLQNLSVDCPDQYQH